MKTNHFFMSQVKFTRGKNVLWLWVLPVGLSWLVICLFVPAGLASGWFKAAVIGMFSFICGYVLAWKNFKTLKRRLLAGLFFTGSSLCLVFSVAFLGCMSGTGGAQSRMQPARFTPAQLNNQRVRREAELVRQEARMKAAVARQIIPRDALADGTMLDLTPFYDDLLNFQNSDNVRSLSPGTHVWNGVKFDARGKIQLIWAGQSGISGIPVGQPCSGIYFLHGVDRGWFPDSVSQFVVHLSGTNVEIVPIVFGRDVADEVLSENNSVVGVMPTNMVVWQESIAAGAAPHPLKAFFVTRWNNPSPEETVVSIDFKPGHEVVNAFLVAITLKPVISENK